MGAMAAQIATTPQNTWTVSKFISSLNTWTQEALTVLSVEKTSQLEMP